MCYQSHKLHAVRFLEAGHLLSLVVVFPLVDQGCLKVLEGATVVSFRPQGTIVSCDYLTFATSNLRGIHCHVNVVSSTSTS